MRKNRPEPEPQDDDVALDPVAEQIEALTEFVSSFAPAIGERSDGTYPMEDEESRLVVEARDHALIEAFQAIGRLARKIR